MESRKLQNVIGSFIALLLLISTQSLSAQCSSTGFGLSQFTVLSSQQNVSATDELSGLTYNDVTDEFVSISDGGSIAERHPLGFWSAYGISGYGSPHCDDSRFSDIEAITYIRTNGNTHQYAIADERDRALVFVDISNSQTGLTHPSTYLKFSGLSCGDNDGIEGAAYDSASGKMYFATELDDQKIYSFTVPTNINGQTVNVTEVADLQNITGLNTFSTHALDVLPNGNIIALVTKPGSGNDNGLYDRMMIELNPCGDLLGQIDVEPTISNSAELEGIAIKGDDIYLIGEFGVFYQLTREAPSSIQVVSPGTANSLDSGSSTRVNWVSTNLTGNVEIQLFLNGNFVSTLNANTTNDGTQTVTLPTLTTNTSGYTIRVVSRNDASIFGESSTFNIIVPGSITVTSPTSGTQLMVGSSMAVMWTSENVVGNVTLQLLKGGTIISTLASNINNDNVQSVLVPDVADDNDYRVRIVSVTNSSIDGLSDFFTISNPGITVLNPSGGEAFASGDMVSVQWLSMGVTGSVKIELFKGSSLFASLSDLTTNDGINTVTLPNVTTTANDYSIRVTSLVNPAIGDISGQFEIAAQQIFQLTNPSGGETFNNNSFVNVQWNSSFTGTVSIELHKANVFEQVLIASTNDDGTQQVQLPSVQSTSSDYSIKLINNNDNSIFDISNPFTISQTEIISVLTPTSNDIFFVSNQLPITWNSNIGGNVRIELLETGTLIHTLSSSTPNDNAQTFTIPSTLTGGNTCAVRITSLSNPSVSATSSQFQIMESGTNSSDPDLVIQSAGTGVQSDNIYSVNGVTILNQGNGAVAGAYTLGAYLSVDSNITFSDFRIGEVDTYALTGAGQTETSSFSFDVSSFGLADGNYYLGFIVDESDNETEDDEMNNTAFNSTLVNVSQGGSEIQCYDVANSDFSESFETGLGSWTQSANDDTDWTRTNTSTPSSVTGPSAANDGSYYLFTESSNGNRNNTAILTSSCIDLANTISPRLTFDYHMFGSSMGTLKVNIIDENGGSAVAFFQSGDLGDVWNIAAISLSNYIGETVTIEIEANIGVSFRSDMAIDNISIGDTQGCSLVGTPCDDGDGCTIGETYDIDCNCQGGVYTDLDQDGLCVGEDIDDTDPCLPVAGLACISCTSTVSGVFSEGFEGNLDNWTQSASSDNQWIHHSGSTASTRTGPSGASEGIDYMYVEASHGGFPFKRASMNSTCLDLSTLSTPGISFDYNMYGSAMGSLNIFVIDMADGTRTQIFSQSGNQGTEWRSYQRDLNDFADKTVQIKIEAITGFGFRSDIAIDNIEISDTAANLAAAETRNFVELASVNMEELAIESEMLVYPVPAVDFFNIAYQTDDESVQVTLSLVNANGLVIKTETLQLRNGMVEEKVNVSGLPTGTYYATMYSTSSKISKKILIID